MKKANPSKKEEEATEATEATENAGSAEATENAGSAESENPQVTPTNWRSLIDTKYLVPNMSKFPAGIQQKTINVEELDDSQLLILLGGIKEVSHLRGFSAVNYTVHACSQQYVAVSCKIKWHPHAETGDQPVEFEALADAHMDNTKSFAKDFLMAIAENRAFVRCVRSFLRINIVGSDEIGDPLKGQMPQEAPDSVISSAHPVSVLADLMKKANVSFEVVKATVEKEGDESAKEWKELSDIPNKTAFTLIQRIKKKVSGNEDP